MIEAFHMGGIGMFPTAAFGLLLLAASVRYAATPERRFVPLLLSLGVLTLASGGLGFVTGVIKSFTALGVAATDASRIGLVGTGESLCNMALALAVVTLGAVAASIGALRVATGAARTA
jgi:hypothetical protein